MTYIYDNESRLIEVRQGVTPIAEYKYDFAGRRVRKIVGGVVTDYLYDGWQCIAEYNGATSALLRRFYYGPGIDEPIAMQRMLGLYYYHYDGLGSVVALSDKYGSLKEKYEYDVFGRVTIRDSQDQIISTSAYGNPYTFTGRRLDDETGLYYYRARQYNPELGRFMQPDPVSVYLLLAFTENPQRGGSSGMALSVDTMNGFLKKNPLGRFMAQEPKLHLAEALAGLPGEAVFYIDLNLYNYAGNNPLIFVDPYGLGFWKDLWGAKGWIGGLVIAPIGGLILVAGAPVIGGIMLGVGVGLVITEAVEVMVGGNFLGRETIEQGQENKNCQQEQAEDLYPVGE